MSELFLRFPEYKMKAVTLSYDDGQIFDRQMVEILNAHNIKCTFNLNSGSLGIGNRIAKDEVGKLYCKHEVAVHTFRHPHLENLDDTGVIREVFKDRENLELLTGKFVNGMAYPYGLKDHERIPDLIKNCGIHYARTTNSTFGFELPNNYLRWNPTCHHSYHDINALIDTFLIPEDKSRYWNTFPKLFYLWGHSYEFENKFDKLEDICNRLGGKETVWYATNGEIIEYLSAFKSLRFSADGKRVYNPSVVEVYGWCDGKNICLAPGKITIISKGE